MTRKLNTLFAAAVLTGIATATAAFAAVDTSTPQPPRTQVGIAHLSRHQTSRMTTMTTDRSNALTGSDQEHPHFQARGPGGGSK
jgi:hypothetical protein